MKKIFVLVLTLTFCSLSAQVLTSSWDFPVKPGSKQWKALKSHNEMVEICQIPNDILQSLSTKDLLKICLDYPLFFTLAAFNNMQEGFEQVSTEFNGFKELYQRDDIAKELPSLYSSISPGDVNLIPTELGKGRFMFRLFYLELMLAQNDLFLNLSSNERNDLIIEAFQKTKEKQEFEYSTFQTRASYLLLGRLLVFEKFDAFTERITLKPVEFNAFLETIFLTDMEILDEIEDSAKEYILGL